MNELDTAKNAVVLRLIAQRNGVDLTRKERFDAREIATLINVMLLEQEANE